MTQLYSRVLGLKRGRLTTRSGASAWPFVTVPLALPLSQNIRKGYAALSTIAARTSTSRQGKATIAQRVQPLLLPAEITLADMLGKRLFHRSTVVLKSRDDGKSGDDGDNPKKRPPKGKDEPEKDDEPSNELAENEERNGRRRRAPRRSENENENNSSPAAAGNGAAKSSTDPLTQLKRAVGVADYGQGQQSFIPDTYPNVMMLPITRRPLFPSLYKSIQVQDPQVIGALKELVERGEPYVATFMLKNDDKDVDSIKDMNEVHEVGVFSRIMSIYVSPNPEDKHLTVALYPWRRVRMKRILKPTEKDAEEAEAEKSADEGDSGYAGKASEGSESGTDVAASKKVLRSIKLDYNFTAIEVENVVDEPYDPKDATISATMSEIVSVLREITTMNPMFREQIHHFASAQVSKAVFENPSKLADFAAALSGGSSEELQDILSDLNVATRLEKALVVLKKELMNAQLQNKISKDVEAKISKRQRDFYLMEQLKGIKRELGLESDGKDKLIEQFKTKAEALKMPADVKKVFDEEIGKLAHLEPAASEFNVTRNYLDWLTQIPWGKYSVEDYDLQKARVVLDEDHYGLDDVKQRILEFIAVGKLRGAVQGKILCFVGPPGVGKTSIGKSIARSLSREFYRFSVGGLTDVAEIKGHRRTYVGAMPGKVVQALKRVQTENPLLLIDEIDKLGRGHQGDPASALLELLDPEQNNAFLDHYMDVPVDLSRVLFVCTANVTDTIPGPLLDRMEIIRLSGYLADEKLSIAQKYLAPQAKEAAGLAGSNIVLSDGAVDALVRNYCRESGVRNLKKHIEKIFRKAALKVIEDDVAEPSASTDNSDRSADTAPEPSSNKASSSEATGNESKSAAKDDEEAQNDSKVRSTDVLPQKMVIPQSYALEISAGSLKDYVGPPVFESDRLYETTPPGVVMGLAWTSMGGSALYIESVVESTLSSENSGNGDNSSHSGRLQATGQLGDVMKESSVLAYTYVRSLLNKRDPENKFFSKHIIHMHVPEGATPKDGPSAGVTMTTALLSLALDRPIQSDVAMTGELTLTGRVLKIGGLKEKTIAARRSGVKRILFPKANVADWEELPENVKEGIEGCPIEWYEQIPPLVGLD
ncbi:ATP-dependent Lon protease pim1 [Coemansia sp. RSA 1813]|nr:ATP-dependent Lon protease pim1 [Coemansia sp. RSA 1646]KAJ1769131.1 ATP-dependent Lon protease pim1 [Coemansia sp. RSA 1843]KAJ2091916.1 ATP-dependent Lon protease pim1 [Coemansia sp. RSA 986]KAJ2212459.1 ATP-dependent Lon protease pim1 [Coemansia sp. RSA 487]KAJ2571689.1 ATP-dependent Lon protease pim1 [Coemansia sp. RSA 1813]